MKTILFLENPKKKIRTFLMDINETTFTWTLSILWNEKIPSKDFLLFNGVPNLQCCFNKQYRNFYT
jgi:hypothetical protein